ncbi:MAG: DUF433 domain-containing protein [Proteobacteria bacterium]|nr:DUF433 domain-containing protein [Pseudomonadota bacterium]
MNQRWESRIELNPKILGGKPVIRGTRISMDLILGSLAEGISYDEIKSEYGIKQDDIRAALAYASAALSGEEVA